jgi:membrane protein implicated in regulation of membrane protease activity
MVLARNRKKVEWTRARIAAVVFLTAGLSILWTNIVLTFLGWGISVLWLVAVVLSFCSVICMRQARKTRSVRKKNF